jgi:cadmium resistance transport/sequestration family protein
VSKPVKLRGEKKTMTEILTAIVTGVAAFIATNLDDILILTLLFTQVNQLFRRRHIIIGQYLGFSLLILASLTGFFGSFFLPILWIRWLGLIPVALGIFNILQGEEEDNNIETVLETSKSSFLVSWLSPQTCGVAALTIANGSDNIGIYVPLFASSTLGNLVTIVSVFMILVGVWCFTAHQLTHLPAIANLITSHGSHFVPCVLIGLGVFIIKESLPLAFLALSLSYLWVILFSSQQSAVS